MTSTPLHSGLRHRLLQQLTAKHKRPQSAISQGFTLVELLVVVIIIGILSAVALPGFLNQADKAKDSSAKALLASIAKECQIYLIEKEGDFEPKTKSVDNIELSGDACEGTFTAAIDGGKTLTIEVDDAGTITGPTESE